MKPVNAQTVQERISYLENKLIECHEISIREEFELDCMRHLLASLTAEPVGYVSKNSRDLADAGHLGYISNHIVAGLEGGYVYEAPPTPAIRLPDVEKLEALVSAISVRIEPIGGQRHKYIQLDEVMACLAEVKRLNATAPSINLLELVPPKASQHTDPRNRGEFYHEMECRAWDKCREAILRKIEEAK